VPQTGRYPGVPISELSDLNWSYKKAILHTSTPQEVKYILEDIKPIYTLAIGSLYLIGELFEALNLNGLDHLEMFTPNTQR
jgi:hypothetical protein